MPDSSFLLPKLREAELRNIMLPGRSLRVLGRDLKLSPADFSTSWPDTCVTFRSHWHACCVLQALLTMRPDIFKAYHSGSMRLVPVAGSKYVVALSS